MLYHGEIYGNKFTDFGVIEKLYRPHVYSYRYWSDNHGTERVDENYLTITYRLESITGGTLLKVNQTNIKSPELYELMDSQVWSYLLSSLKQYIEPQSSDLT
ncbi:SRPBCC domain-containing protein [Rubritalea profundi]|uniref:SRPBCC domain-containing protein n=1 Tax=Rubritalea profundi TaxID=1658618 RepID=UPI00197FDC99